MTKQDKTLKLIQSRDPVTVNELIEITGYTRSSVYSILAQLRAHGLIQKTESRDCTTNGRRCSTFTASSNVKRKEILTRKYPKGMLDTF